jgi:hypothetical protein
MASESLCHDPAVLRAILFLAFLAPLAAAAQTKLAEGFSRLPDGARVVLMPADIELFEISAGGVIEPRADWTDIAARHIRDGVAARHSDLKEVRVEEDEAMAALLRLHRAVTEAIVVHHYGSLRLPSKEGRLDWSLGPAAATLAERSGADHALFIWIRDTYASGARKAAITVGALFGLALGGGSQLAYASLVDLKSGQVLWFNRLRRMSGDLREAEAAGETLERLLESFPR